MKCKKCGSANIVTNGHTATAQQQYYCRDCRFYTGTGDRAQKRADTIQLFEKRYREEGAPHDEHAEQATDDRAQRRADTIHLFEKQYREEETPHDEHAEQAAAPHLYLAIEIWKGCTEQIDIADTKVRGLFAATTILLAALSLSGPRSYSQIVAGGLTASEVMLASLHGLVLLLVALSILLALLALIPRIRIADTIQTPVFFGHLAGQQPESLRETFQQLDEQTAIGHFIDQARMQGIILLKKYKYTKWSGYSLGLAVCIWLLQKALEFWLT